MYPPNKQQYGYTNIETVKDRIHSFQWTETEGGASNWETCEGDEHEDEMKAKDGGSVDTKLGWITAGCK